jgi:hypothetical protein
LFAIFLLKVTLVCTATEGGWWCQLVGNKWDHVSLDLFGGNYSDLPSWDGCGAQLLLQKTALMWKVFVFRNLWGHRSDSEICLFLDQRFGAGATLGLCLSSCHLVIYVGSSLGGLAKNGTDEGTSHLKA